ncbi:phenylacetaldoxime dehydratase family protein [Actinosynnema sp. CS-041913]|uniref:phenylacetaldoxime dehydratase family protein n=1 Tax=Actinosynnema sp. CS-041913 TaxID=3239917 RepID=UPI003D924BB5
MDHPVAAAHLDPRLQRTAPNRPPGHSPRGGPALQVVLPVERVVVQRIGVQGDRTTQASDRLRELLAGPHGPARAERTEDRDHDATEVVVCYWTDPDEHTAWWTSEPVRTWWDDLPTQGPVGHWHETTTIPADRIETMYSSPLAAGLAALAPSGLTDLHDYPGAMRDRFAASDHTDLTTAAGTPLRTDLPPGTSPRGRRVRLLGPSPEGLCWVRTAQDWASAPADQVAAFQDVVEPTYRAGYRHLATAPAEEGCLSAQLVGDLDPDGDPKRSSAVVAWFRGITDLERWAHHHPTHHAILNAFWTALVAPYMEQLKLVLWHEVHVLPAGALEFEYVNCADGTGLLSVAGQGDQARADDAY